jgi:hypothetical protein
VTRRAAATLAVAALVVVGARAAPASADPPRPTDYRSTVTAVEPAAGGALRAEIVGGDAFLELQVDEGHEAVVHGYGDEPYLRFLADGTVERNTRSEATYLNADRQGAVDLPDRADNAAEPDWEQVADGGTYAWHDHRIHWMGGEPPAGAGPGDVVLDWTVRLDLDGVPTEVRGTLVRAEDVSPLPWLAAGAAALAVAVLAGRRRPLLAAGLAALVAATGAAAVGWAEYSVAPAGSGANPLLVLVPAVGVGTAAVGLGLRRRMPGPVALLASAAATLGWGMLRASVLWTPVLPTDAPFWLDRAVTAVALGLAAAPPGLVVWSGALVLGPRPPVPAPSQGPDATRAAATDGGGEPR